MWFLFSVEFSGISISFRETACCVECFWWLIPAFRALAENLCQHTLNLNEGCPHPAFRLGISVQPNCPIFHLGSHFPCWRHCSPAPEDWGWTPLPEPFEQGRNCPENGETRFTWTFRRRCKKSWGPTARPSSNWDLLMSAFCTLPTVGPAGIWGLWPLQARESQRAPNKKSQRGSIRCIRD